MAADDDCYVCLEPLSAGVVAETHPCGHLVHKSCFVDLIVVVKPIDCPICRRRIDVAIVQDTGFGCVPPLESDAAFTTANGILYDWQWNDKVPNDQSHLIYSDRQPPNQSIYDIDLNPAVLNAWLADHEPVDRDIYVYFPGEYRQRIQVSISTAWTDNDLKDYFGLRCGISAGQVRIVPSKLANWRPPEDNTFYIIFNWIG